MEMFASNQSINNQVSPLETAQFNLDDLLLDDWSSGASPHSINSIETTSSNQMVNVNSDNDSDSGIGISSSSSNSPKAFLNDNLNDFLNDQMTNENFSYLDFVNFDNLNVHRSDSISSNNTNDNQLVLIDQNGTNSNYLIPLVHNLNSNESSQHSTQSFSNQANTEKYLSSLNNILIENNKLIDSNEDDISVIGDTCDTDEDTETLLNNIESMLKSLQNHDDLDNQNKRIQTQKNLIKAIRQKKKVKNEPLDNSKSQGCFKKISPKVSQNQTQKIILPLNQVLTVPSPETLKQNTQTFIIKDTNNSNDLVQLLGSQKQQQQHQVLNIIKPASQTQQPITVLNTLPTCNSYIIANSTTSSVIPNTIIIDSQPSPKRLKVETRKSVSPTQTVQLVPQPAQSLIITSPSSNLLNTSNGSFDPDILKKQSRMIKNRESACLSRKRKKEYMQTLETSLQEEKDKNEKLVKENEELRNKVKVLEAENNLLRSQKPQYQTTQIKLIENKPIGTTIKTLKTFPLNSTTLNTTNLSSFKTLAPTPTKRPFTLYVIILLFGLNIFQFIDLNSSTNGVQNPLQVYQMNDKNVGMYINNEETQLAALASVRPKDGALVDSSVLKQIHSRRLLSDTDYPIEDSAERQVKSETKGLSNKTSNLTRAEKPLNSTNGENMELVLINGTWHLIDLNICYQKLHSEAYNQTHVRRINSELNGFYERHSNVYQQKPANQGHQNPFSSSLLKKNKNQEIPSKRREFRRNLVKQEYPVSIYDTQSTKHESFARSIRQNNDTFYYVSFRRDHVMLPALIQNKTIRPKLSLLLPALLTNNLNNSNDKQSTRQITFMKIDCEVTDAKLFQMNLDDIPLDYMKIIHQDYLMNQPQGDSNESYKNF